MREIPRESEVIELFKKLVAVVPLAERNPTVSFCGIGLSYMLAPRRHQESVLFSVGKEES
jgi:hypothetical protein